MHSANYFAAFLTKMMVATTVGSCTIACMEHNAAQEAAPPAAAAKVIAGDLYQFQPETPTELIEAAQVTAKLDRPGDGRAFLKKLLDMQLGANDWQKLRNDLGPSPFLELRQDIRLRPESEQLLAAVNAASRAQTWSANELQDLVLKLAVQGSTGANAATELIASGDAALPHLLAADLSTPTGKIANQLIVQNAYAFRASLLSSITEANPDLQARLIQILGTTADPSLSIRLWRWRFAADVDPAVAEVAQAVSFRLNESSFQPSSGPEASAILLQNAEALLKQAGARWSSMDTPADLRELVAGDERTRLLKHSQELLDDALVIEPENARASTVRWVVQCASLSPALTAEATVAIDRKSSELLAGLDVALELHPVAAIEFLRGLRTATVDPSDFVEAGRVLSLALASPDVRVRFLASAIVDQQLQVEVSSTAIRRTLEAAQQGSLLPEVVIITPDDDKLRTLQLVFQDAKYSAQIAETGPVGVDLAFSQMNCELIVLDAAAPLWPIATTLANLRADIRTRNTPVVVIGDDRFAARVLALTKTYPGVWFVAEPAGTDSLLLKIAQLNLPGLVLPAEERAAMKTLAK
jgi:hypothetical protein